MNTNIYNIISKEYNNRKNKLLCKDSKAESHFAKLLNNANIFYKKEKCCYNKYGKWCYIDFYLPLYKIAIEIDGIEHSYGERKRKDVIKTLFLKKDRSISTIRYSNQESMQMSSISIVDIVKKANKISSNDDLEYKRKQKQYELSYVEKTYGIVANKDFWLFDKDKDEIFHFKDIYLVKHNTELGYKSIINILNKGFSKSRIYIISDNYEYLKNQIDLYYDYLWKK